jgi:hypothetical protein
MGLPKELKQAIAWATKNRWDKHLCLALKPDKCLGTNNAQWLRQNTQVIAIGKAKNGETVVKLIAKPGLVAEMSQYKSDKGGTYHPVNSVVWGL